MQKMKPLIKPAVAFALNINSLEGKHLGKVVAAALMLAMLVGCSDDAKPTTQLVAKINDDELSVHQINNAVARIPNVTPDLVEKVRHDTLDNMVNQQLAMQQAIAMKLDRSTEVMMQIDAANREILTNAYIKQFVGSLPQPSMEDAKKFYAAHPELFAERRIYSMQEISIKAPLPDVEKIKSSMGGKKMPEIAAYLKQEDIVYSSHSGVRAAEQIPQAMLAEVASMQDGQINIIESEEMISIIHLVKSEVSAISEQQAMEHIPQYLINEQAKKSVDENFAELKSRAQIVYLNEFAEHKDNSAMNPAKQALDTQPASIPVNQTQTDPEKKPGSIEKGLTGLN